MGSGGPEQLKALRNDDDDVLRVLEGAVEINSITPPNTVFH